MEIITGVERRRHWRIEDKLRIVAEAERPGARFVDVARRARRPVRPRRRATGPSAARCLRTCRASGW